MSLPSGRLTATWWPAVRFAAVIGAASLLYSLVSWGRANVPPPETPSLAALVPHMLGHAVFGGLVAAGTRRPWLILASALGACVVDFDHTLYYLHLPLSPRASHSIGFFALAPAAMALAARSGWLGGSVTIGEAARLGFACAVSHVAWDAATAPQVPLWYPVLPDLVTLSLGTGLVLELLAFSLASGPGVLRRILH